MLRTGRRQELHKKDGCSRFSDGKAHIVIDDGFTAILIKEIGEIEERGGERRKLTRAKARRPGRDYGNGWSGVEKGEWGKMSESEERTVMTKKGPPNDTERVEGERSGGDIGRR